MTSSMATIDARDSQSGGLLGLLMAIAIGVFYFFASLRLGVDQAAGVDSSWQVALAHDFLTGAHWGRDVVFTYGPLGFLHPSGTTYPPLFPLFFIAQVLVTFGFAWLVGAAAYRLSVSAAVMWLASLALWAPWLPAEVSWLIVLPLALHPLLRARAALAVATLALLTVLALIKVNTLPPLCIALFATAAVAFGERRRGRAALLLLGFPVLFLAGWIACRQSLSDLLPFLLLSSQVAAGYTSGMSIEPPLLVECGGLIVMALTVGWCLLLGWTERTERRLPILSLYGLLLALVAWKSFYTRADGHVFYFFCFAALFPWSLLAYRKAPRGMTVAAALVVLATLPARAMIDPKIGPPAWADIKNHIAANVAALANPAAVVSSRMTAWQNDSMSAGLPLLNQQVGENAIDVLGNYTRIALSSGLNYTHRPSIQSYAAYTPDLARRNADFFTAAKAPEFVLFDPLPIDGHLPAQEDALAFLAILRGYRPVKVERGHTLAQRIDANSMPAQESFPPLQAVSLGEWIDVPPAKEQAGMRVALLVQTTLIGRAFSTLLREPELRLELVTDDGAISNWKLLRPTAAEGFLISPLIRSGYDWIESQGNVPAMTVRRLRVLAPTRRARWSFAPNLGYAFATATLNRPIDTVKSP